MVKKQYVPQRGDIVRLNFDPQSGHGQKGWRPALVLSNATFNGVTSLAVACPITSHNRNYPFHVPLSPSEKTKGVVMVDQVKSLDYVARKVRFVEKVSQDVLAEVEGILEAILGED